MKIRVALLDDESLAIEELKSMLNAYGFIEVVATFTNPQEALDKIPDLEVNLVFLDIQMPGMSGFEWLEKLDNAPEIIFVTAYDQFALKAFEVSALDYILKPVNTDRLSEALERIKKRLKPDNDQAHKLSIDKRIFIKDGEQCYFVPLAEIFLLESVGNYVRVYYQDKKPLLHKSLNYMEEKLPDEFFFRANRQHMFNVTHITNINPYFNSTLQVELKNGIKVDISQRQSVRFKDKMGV
ncbi:MAG: DNA-binding response regulator [Cytophagia bacterium]|nr:DNA-binding response regulator [Cytophagia bacterium]